MKSGYFALTALITLTFSHASFAAPDAPKLNLFSYRLKLPADFASCKDHAETVAAAFARGASQAKDVTGVCQRRESMSSTTGEAYDLDIVLINYKAPTEQVPNRSVFGANAFLDTPDPKAGVFATHAECVSEIAAQTPIFTAETGLTPYTAYCQASSNSTYPGFSMTIESFGAFKKRRLYAYSLDNRAKFGTDGSRITQAALAAIHTAGGRVVSSSATRLFYYSEHPIQIANRSLGIFASLNQCSSQLETAHAIYAKSEHLGVSSFCLIFPVPAELVGKVNESYVLMVVGAGQNMLLDSAAATYESFDECMSDIERLIQNSVSNGRKILGGICSPGISSEGDFDARLYHSLY